MESRSYKPFEPNQPFLLPPAIQEWLPDDHLAYFLLDVVGELDLSEIYTYYDHARGGPAPYDPRMMVGLLLYGYCVGMPSSRKIEKATYESVPFRILSGGYHPDHDTIADFRKRHLKTLSRLFFQVLEICRKAGLVKLGHVALDGTKMKANASKHKAMSYGRMGEKSRQLEKQIQGLMDRAAGVDADEDRRYGKGKWLDALPKELRFKQSRLQKIREAKAALEQEARDVAEKQRAERVDKERLRREKGESSRGKKLKEPSEIPSRRSQRNFTDPDSRIMKDGATKAFMQGYNAQAAVDAPSQIIVATHVTQQTNDKKQVQPVMEKLEKTLHQLPEKVSADSGYFSESNVNYLEEKGVDVYMATQRIKHGDSLPVLSVPPPNEASVKERMRYKLQTKKGREMYSKRKETAEPVFGQIKHVRNLRQFLLRGLQKVYAEWDLICMGHNLLKLHRSGYRPGSPLPLLSQLFYDSKQTLLHASRKFYEKYILPIIKHVVLYQDPLPVQITNIGHPTDS